MRIRWRIVLAFVTVCAVAFLLTQTDTGPDGRLPTPVRYVQTVPDPSPHNANPSNENPVDVSIVKERVTQATVKVAAIQCYSRMGKSAYNRQLLSDLITNAAEQGAKIVLLPECAVQGYMNPADDCQWSTGDAADGNDFDVKDAAEHVPGPSSRYFAGLSKRLGIYLGLPLIEEEHGEYYNSLLLFDPIGEIAAHHRKCSLWPPGDAGWVKQGEGIAQVVSTPYGRLGLMICHDVHAMPSRLKAARTDIVLYAVGWYGPHTENWFRDLFPRRYVVPNNFAVIAANWCAEEKGSKWDGQGYSCIIGRGGEVLSMAKGTGGPEIVLAELPVAAASATANPGDE